MNFLKFRDEKICLVKFRDQNSILAIFLINRIHVFNTKGKYWLTLFCYAIGGTSSTST